MKAQNFHRNVARFIQYVNHEVLTLEEMNVITA